MCSFDWLILTNIKIFLVKWFPGFLRASMMSRRPALVFTLFNVPGVIPMLNDGLEGCWSWKEIQDGTKIHGNTFLWGKLHRKHRKMRQFLNIRTSSGYVPERIRKISCGALWRLKTAAHLSPFFQRKDVYKESGIVGISHHKSGTVRTWSSKYHAANSKGPLDSLVLPVRSSLGRSTGNPGSKIRTMIFVVGT